MVENSLSPFMALISSVLARHKLKNFSVVEVTGFYSPRPTFFDKNVLKVPTMDGRDFDFPKNRQGKKVS